VFTIRPSRLIALLLAILISPCASPAGDPAVQVTFQDDRSNAELQVQGRILVEAADGGILVEDDQQRLWAITPDRLRSKDLLPLEHAPLSAQALETALMAELGRGFTAHRTAHYVLCSNAEQAYVEWVGSLFERLQRAFLQTWKQAGWELSEPGHPLPAIVFRTQEEYAEFATRDAGPEMAKTAGYYSIRTNRIVLYDLARAGGGPAGSTRVDVERRVAAAPANVATIVHEATHQIAFNCGMHTRYADTPMWLAEGIAMYCETPDLRSGAGWRTIGRPNLHRLRQFRDYLAQRRRGDSLSTLIRDETRFRDPDTMSDAYAESWALVDFLMRQRRDDFIAYLKQVAAKPRLRWDDAQTRMNEFVAALGPLPEVEADCQAHIRRIRAK
jgi:hypothetical protein